MSSNIKKISLKQIVGSGYDDFLTTQKRYRVCKGSRGSKKSKTTALDVIRKIIKYPKCNWLVVRRTGRTLKDSCYSDLIWAMRRLEVEDYFKCTVSPLEITYLPTGQKILFRGLDDGLKVTSISVPNGVLNFVWIEEAYEITNEDDFNKLDMSIRGEVPKDYFKQITITFNPWSATSFLKSRFFDVIDDDIFTKTTTWQCNEWLDESDRKIFLKMKENNPRRYRIEGDGEWGIADGLIYDKFEYTNFDINEIKAIVGIKSSFSLDFGYTDPNAFICALVDSKNYKIYVFDEWYKNNTTNQKIAEQIKNMGYGGQRIICDCAEPKSIQELRDSGIRAEKSIKGKDSVNYGIQQLQNYTFIVHTKCREFYKEINNYCWAKDKNGNPTDKPEHDFSHGMDSIRYGVTKIIMPETFSFD